jgi:hypothetical protein
LSRVAITLDEHAQAELARRAQANHEPVARTAARLVRDGLLSTQAPPPEAPAAGPAREPERQAGTPAWLEPEVSARERWRRETWAAVCALYERYPKQLEQLSEDWWRDRAQVETLAALALWRSQLDAGASEDPRAELLFHDRLEIVARQLRERLDRLGERFVGGPPPEAWLA